MVKASEFKNVCKAVNDRQLESLKKEIIEILKKQDEKDVKKAIDYFNSQEEHYTHLEKSHISGKWIQKAGYGVGTVRIWKGKKYKKIAPGKWARVFDKEGRGTNIAIGKLISRVQKIDNVEDLMAFVMANKQRFVDENGVDLPVLDKLRAAVDARNNGGMGSKGTSKLDNSADKVWYKIRELEDVMSISNNDKESVSKNAKKAEQLEKEIQAMKGGLSAKDKKQVEEWYEEKINQNLKEDFEKKKKVLNEKPAENKKDYSEGNWGDPKNDIAFFLKNEHTKDLKDRKDSFETREGHKYKVISEDGNKYEIERTGLDGDKKIFSVETMGYGKGFHLTKVEETEAEKTQNRSEAMKGNQNAYKGKAEEVANKKLLSKEEMLKKPISKIYQYANADVYDMEKFKTIDEALEDSLETHKGSIEIGELTEDEDTIAERVGKEWAKKQNHDIAREILKDEKDGKLVVNEDGIFEEKKETEKKTKPSKPSTGVYTPSESTDMETKKAIAENKSVGENEVQLPYSKELEAEIKSLKNCASTDPTREFMKYVYYENGNLIATDGRRIKFVKVGELDGIENGSYVDIDISKNGINLKKREGMEGKQYPNYSRVIPDNLSQKVTLKNDVIKEKIKEMKKDGAIDKKVGRVQLEFKDGKVYLDDTEIGEAQNINLKYSDGWGPARNETNLINVNADYLVNALNGDSSILMLGERADKAMGISTDSTTNIIMPLNGGDTKMDYSAGRSEKAAENEKKNKEKAEIREFNEKVIEQYTPKDPNVNVEQVIERMKSMSDEDLKREYGRLNFDFNKVMDKRRFLLGTNKVDSKLGLDLRTAAAYKGIVNKYPEIKDKVIAELESRGVSVKKSLFDGFLGLELLEEDIDDIEEDEEEESLFNDYSAEQPDLFNSTEFKVREAFNRCCDNCL